MRDIRYCIGVIYILVDTLNINYIVILFYFFLASYRNQNEMIEFLVKLGAK
jgi:hypothetical protein